MKGDANVRAILATRSFAKAELYTFVLVGGLTLRFTTAQRPITVGGNTYDTGLIIQRGAVKNTTDFEIGNLSLTIWPQLDKPGGAVTVGGAAFVSAARARAFDDARVTMGKIFFPVTNMAWDTSAASSPTTWGLVPSWYTGRVNIATPGRFKVEMEIHDDLETLNIAMPRNIIQIGCLHTLYDTGCTLSEATFTSTGATTGTPTVTGFNTNLTQVDKYFNLGRITFTSGPNNGVERVVKTFLHTSGAVQLIRPFPSAPGAGDTFSITAGCPKTQAACENTSTGVGPPFNNKAHFRGMPYVPVPETLYDGGTSAASVPVDTPGHQGDQHPVSKYSGGLGGNYKP